jgi:hypothetical protein
LTKSGSWFLAPDRVYPQAAEGRTTAEQEVLRQLVPLLHARRDAGFTAAAVAGGTVDGVSEDRVRIQHGAVDVTLGLDKASGLPHSVSFVGRGTRPRSATTRSSSTISATSVACGCHSRSARSSTVRPILSARGGSTRLRSIRRSTPRCSSRHRSR